MKKADICAIKNLNKKKTAARIATNNWRRSILSFDNYGKLSLTRIEVREPVESTPFFQWNLVSFYIGQSKDIKKNTAYLASDLETNSVLAMKMSD